MLAFLFSTILLSALVIFPRKSYFSSFLLLLLSVHLCLNPFVGSASIVISVAAPALALLINPIRKRLKDFYVPLLFPFSIQLLSFNIYAALVAVSLLLLLLFFSSGHLWLSSLLSSSLSMALCVSKTYYLGQLATVCILSSLFLVGYFLNRERK